MRATAGREDSERAARARAKARRLSREYGLAFSVWRGSDGNYVVTRGYQRPKPVTWARVHD